MPALWKSSDDQSLLIGVDRYGLNAWEEMGNDASLSFQNSMKIWHRKNSHENKSVKRPSMPKPSAGIRRAYALVRYFASRANDPHFEMYTQGDGHSLAASGESDKNTHAGRGTNGVKCEMGREADAETERGSGRREETSGRVGRRKGGGDGGMAQSGGVALGVMSGVTGSSSGRPKTLRQTLLRI